MRAVDDCDCRKMAVVTVTPDQPRVGRTEQASEGQDRVWGAVGMIRCVSAVFEHLPL